MTCNSAQSRLSAYADGELSGNEMKSVREHLHSCKACTAEYETVSSLKSLIGRMVVPPPNGDLENRLMAAIAQADIETTRRSWRPVFYFGGLAMAGAVATLVILNLMPKTPVAKDPDTAPIAFEVQRDQIYSVGLDPMRSPTISTSHGFSP